MEMKLETQLELLNCKNHYCGYATGLFSVLKEVRKVFKWVESMDWLGPEKVSN